MLHHFYVLILHISAYRERESQANCSEVNKATESVPPRAHWNDLLLERWTVRCTHRIWSYRLPKLIDTVNLLKAKGIGFRVLTQQLDTTTTAGMLIFHVFGAIAEFERSLIQERTSAGLKAARARGRFGGRPKTMDKKKLSIAESLYRDGKTNVSEICKTLGISRATFYLNINPLAA